ncbi:MULTISPECIES: hypothetical protein [Cytobacillus]|nr:MULTISPECIES: hypothetical protein [Cytobacillus]MDK7667366.1 hypothetical protein [Cytobacillus oceanisediminis]MEC1157782.1 hypothetical protein [Cytobacillus horneckiae]SGI86106.1 Uncharacterised protein [Mycobacterium tuberculosis]
MKKQTFIQYNLFDIYTGMDYQSLHIRIIQEQVVDEIGQTLAFKVIKSNHIQHQSQIRLNIKVSQHYTLTLQQVDEFLTLPTLFEIDVTILKSISA